MMTVPCCFNFCILKNGSSDPPIKNYPTKPEDAAINRRKIRLIFPIDSLTCNLLRKLVRSIGFIPLSFDYFKSLSTLSDEVCSQMEVDYPSRQLTGNKNKHKSRHTKKLRSWAAKIRWHCTSRHNLKAGTNETCHLINREKSSLLPKFRWTAESKKLHVWNR